jgi:hypothetical protein
MSLSSRTLRCSVLGLSCLLPAVCAAQPGVPQFVQPIVEYTGGRVASFVPGSLQGGLTTQDILYINAATVSGSTSSVLVGELLSTNQGQGLQNLNENQITFPNVSNVVAALAPFQGRSGITDYAFALTRTAAGGAGPNLCVYYGTGNGLGGFAYDDGPGSGVPPQYPPLGGKSGCLTFNPLGNNPPVFSYIAAPSFQSGQRPNLILEDSANNYLYVFRNSGTTALNGTLTGFTLVSTIAIPAADGAGPIYIGDFDHDGYTDFIVNNQISHSATVYFGNGDGTFQPPRLLPISGHVNSMLLQDMNGDGIPDLVVEGDRGVIQIYKGAHSATAPFGTVSIGGTAVGVDGFSGNGGHLAGIYAEAANPAKLDILTTTPIGLSVLQPQAVGSLTYALQGIYNIGPGRSSFALGMFRSNGGVPVLAVDSPEGVAIVLGDTNGDGGFQTSKAYSALAPALGATIGKFRNARINAAGYLDVVVATSAVQGQLLTNNRNGAFTTFPAVANPSGVPGGVPANLWSSVVSGDFNGDGVADIAYSLTGFPLPIPGLGPSVGPGLYVQFANGDGTFQPPVALAGASSNNNLYGETVVGDFDGNGLIDLANTDPHYMDTLLAQSNGSFNVGLNLQSIAAGVAPIAAGFFKEGRTSRQDLVTAHDGALWPYLNSGNGTTFIAEPKILTAIAPSTLLLTDVDGDGFDDIVLLTQVTDEGSKPNQLLIWWGNGDGTFSTQFTILNLARNYYLGAVADMNSDGLPDIILSDGQLVSILYNLGNRTFRNDFGTNCSVCGEQHFLAGQGINSLTLASVTGTSKYDLVVANGGTENSNAIVLTDNLPSSGSSTAVLTPNPDVNTGGITVLANNITTSPVTGSLTATPNPSLQAAAFTLTATLMSAQGVAEPTGTVEFFVGTSVIPVSGFVPLTAGTNSSTASFTVTAAANTYLPGTYAISAFYGGDLNNSQATLNGTLTITNTGTTTTLYLCIGPTAACPSTGSPTVPAPPWPTMLSMYYGQSFNGVTGATANDGSALSATSVIDFNDAYNGAAPVTECQLAIGPPLVPCPPAVGTTVGTGVGTHIFTSVYLGDATHAGSTSIPVTITVSPDTVTAILISSLNPATQGQSVTFTATFTGNFAAPTGTVQFSETFPPTATVLLLGPPVTLVPGTGLSSTATFTTSTLPVGTDPITASYAATTDFNGASATVNQVINPQNAPSFTLAVTPTTVTGLVGEAAFLTVTVTAQNGFTQTVNLTCSNLPSEATCIFLGPTITGGGSSTLVVSNTAPHTCGTTQPYFVGGGGGIGRPLAPFALPGVPGERSLLAGVVPALAGLLALFLPGRRRWLRVLIVLAVAAVAVQITGCGTCTDLGTRPGTYTFQVTGTSTGTSEVQSQPVTLTVTI